MTWLSDTLSKRLLILMWATLVASHLIAFFAVRAVVLHPDGSASDVGLRDLPTLPSMPPTFGSPGTGRGPGAPPPDAGRPGPGGTMSPDRPRPPDASAGPPSRAGGGALPPNALLLDYGIRFVVIAMAAWLGSLWLSRPMRRLAAASRSMGSALERGGDVPRLDEHSGTVEVRETAKVFNGMAEQLRRQFQGRGLLFAALSHDLKTPLTRIRMRLEAMAGNDELRRRSVEDVREMDALIGSVLEMFQLEGAPAAVASQQTDIAALVQAIVDNLGEQGMPITCTADAAVVSTEPESLRRIVGNLVINAVRYGERAEVRVRSRPADVTITIDDQGPGIPQHELEAVFQPFYRLDASRRRSTGGTGLGLYIARQLVARIGGQLTLQNLPTRGLRALVVLPRGRPPL